MLSLLQAVYADVSVTVNLAQQLPPLAHVDQAYDWTFLPNTFTSDTDSKLRYQADGLPSWAKFDKATGRISGKPTKSGRQDQSNDVTITASDGSSDASSSFTLTTISAPAPKLNVSLSDQLPKAASMGYGNMLPGNVLHMPLGWSFSIGFSGETFYLPNDDRVYYSTYLQGATPLPNWLVFNEEEMTYSGIAPTQAGPNGTRFDVVLFGSNRPNTGGPSSTFSILLGQGIVTINNTVGALPMANVTEGTPLQYPMPKDLFILDGFSQSPQDYSFSMGEGVPPWISYDEASQSLVGTAPFTENQTQIQNFTVPIEVSHPGALPTTVNLSLSVYPSPFTMATLPNVTVQSGKDFDISLDKYLRDPTTPVNVTFDSVLAKRSLLPADWAHHHHIGRRAAPGWVEYDTALNAIKGTAPLNNQQVLVNMQVDNPAPNRVMPTIANQFQLLVSQTAKPNVTEPAAVHQDHGLTGGEKGAIAGSILGAAVLAALFGLCCFFLRRRRRRAMRHTESADASAGDAFAATAPTETMQPMESLEEPPMVVSSGASNVAGLGAATGTGAAAGPSVEEDIVRVPYSHPNTEEMAAHAPTPDIITNATSPAEAAAAAAAGVGAGAAGTAAMAAGARRSMSQRRASSTFSGARVKTPSGPRAPTPADDPASTIRRTPASSRPTSMRASQPEEMVTQTLPADEPPWQRENDHVDITPFLSQSTWQPYPSHAMGYASYDAPYETHQPDGGHYEETYPTYNQEKEGPAPKRDSWRARGIAGLISNIATASGLKSTSSPTATPDLEAGDAASAKAAPEAEEAMPPPSKKRKSVQIVEPIVLSARENDAMANKSLKANSVKFAEAPVVYDTTADTSTMTDTTPIVPATGDQDEADTSAAAPAIQGAVWTSPPRAPRDAPRPIITAADVPKETAPPHIVTAAEVPKESAPSIPSPVAAPPVTMDSFLDTSLSRAEDAQAAPAEGTLYEAEKDRDDVPRPAHILDGLRGSSHTDASMPPRPTVEEVSDEEADEHELGMRGVFETSPEMEGEYYEDGFTPSLSRSTRESWEEDLWYEEPVPMRMGASHSRPISIMSGSSLGGGVSRASSAQGGDIVADRAPSRRARRHSDRPPRPMSMGSMPVSASAKAERTSQRPASHMGMARTRRHSDRGLAPATRASSRAASRASTAAATGAMKPPRLDTPLDGALSPILVDVEAEPEGTAAASPPQLPSVASPVVNDDSDVSLERLARWNRAIASPTLEDEEPMERAPQLAPLSTELTHSPLLPGLSEPPRLTIPVESGLISPMIASDAAPWKPSRESQKRPASAASRSTQRRQTGRVPSYTPRVQKASRHQKMSSMKVEPQDVAPIRAQLLDQEHMFDDASEMDVDPEAFDWYPYGTILSQEQPPMEEEELAWERTEKLASTETAPPPSPDPLAEVRATEGGLASLLHIPDEQRLFTMPTKAVRISSGGAPAKTKTSSTATTQRAMPKSSTMASIHMAETRSVTFTHAKPPRLQLVSGRPGEAISIPLMTSEASFPRDLRDALQHTTQKPEYVAELYAPSRPDLHQNWPSWLQWLGWYDDAHELAGRVPMDLGDAQRLPMQLPIHILLKNGTEILDEHKNTRHTPNPAVHDESTPLLVARILLTILPAASP